MRLRAASGAVPSGGLLFVFDLVATGLSVFLSLFLRFETLSWSEAVAPFLPIALLPLLVRPPVRMAFGLYQREWRFASTGELRDIVAATLVGSVIILALYGVAAFVGAPGANPFPRSFFLIEPLISLAFVGGARFMLRMQLERQITSRSRDRFVRTLIYGAGEAGASIARSSARDPRLGIHVVGFIDDDPRKHGSRVLGHRVAGPLSQLAEIVAKTDARQLLIAMPSRTGAPIRSAAAAGRVLGLEVKTIPPVLDLLTGEIQVSKPRAISVEDLLRRPPVELDLDSIANYLNGASVMITGGGGSIGAELARQILRIGPGLLTVVDNQEAALWAVERDAAKVIAARGIRFEAMLADVRSVAAMQAVVAAAKPDVVFHAAALKHVPYVERHPSEGVLTNVIGTRNVLDACMSAEVERFVLISTDKAVAPTSVMGTTKRIAELLTIQAGRQSSMPYSAVRFGNVLGSSGSLVPLIERQLDDGIPLTITEPDATRFFMTLSEAVTLILQAGAAASPGELYVLDMGAPVRIGDLIADLLRLRDIDESEVEVRVTGLRPGEKLHERLFFDDERPEPTGHPGILRAVVQGSVTSADGYEELVLRLADMAANRNDAGIVAALRGLELASAGTAATPVRSN